MNLQAGTTVSLRVRKEVGPYGYYLEVEPDGGTSDLRTSTQDVLLHYNEVVGKINEGDTVEVFIFHDTEDRLSATMKQPLAQLGELALLEVVDIHPRLGHFLEIGLGRNLLLPAGELPELEPFRPIIGDYVYVLITHDKQGRMLANLAGEDELSPLTFHAPSSWKNEWVQARVYNTLQMGSFVLCDGGVLGFGVIGFIHHSERPQMLRIGEVVTARVTFIREDGRLNLSLKQPKEIGRIEDAEQILAYLQAQASESMPYSDETPADLITQKFNISKSAFKRALGKLMKQGLVYQKGSWTHLQQGEQQEGQPREQQGEQQREE